MDKKVKELAERLLQSGYDNLPERDQRVLSRIATRASITDNVNDRFHDSLTLGQRLADRVAAFGGSWTFIILFFAILLFWVLLNTFALSKAYTFDPYPFIFLNLILSMVAAFQAPVIMMSQNRQTAKDRMAATLDYDVNLKAELEIMTLHEKIDQLREQHLEQILNQQCLQLAGLRELMETIKSR